MRVYHFLESRWALDDLRRRRLRISRFDRLNDPFEFLALELADPARRARMVGFKKDIAAEFGLICFSSTWSNPLLWSHYADRHRGIALGFDIPSDMLAKVQYTRRRPTDLAAALESPGADGNAAMIALLSTKFSHWRYEREYRAFARLTDGEFEDGEAYMIMDERVVLKEVLVGADCTVSRREVNEAVGDYPDVTRSKVRTAFRTFNMVRNRNPALWT